MRSEGDDVPLSDEEVLRVARLVHENYLRRQAAGEGLDTERATHRDWKHLSPEDRRTNISQVRKHIIGLATVGLTIVPESDPRPAMTEFDLSVLERLGRSEHDRWMDDKYAQGYVWGPARDPSADPPTHPNLVDWDELDDDDKVKDIDPWVDVPSLYEIVGYKVVRISPKS